MDKEPITSNGLKKLKEELVFLKEKKRPEIVAAISEARSHGDLKENAEYHAAREKQGFIEGRLLELENVISRAEVIEIERIQGNKVTFGTTIKIVDEETDEEKVLHIVGQYEANLELGKVSTSSPIVKGLIGKSVGETAEVVTPGGKKFYEVLEISVIDKSIL